MPAPDNRHDMLRAEYKLLGEAACKGCGVRIEWWQTTNRRKMPFNLGSFREKAVPHHTTCPDAGDFRSKPKADPPAAAPAPTTDGGKRLTYAEREIRNLQTRYKARVIVMLMDEGQVAAWRNDVPAEDIRHELITEANRLRSELSRGDVPA